MVYIVFMSIVSDLAAKKHPKKQKKTKNKNKKTYQKNRHLIDWKSSVCKIQ